MKKESYYWSGWGDPRGPWRKEGWLRRIKAAIRWVITDSKRKPNPKDGFYGPR
jgi:hypothetical protein